MATTSIHQLSCCSCPWHRSSLDSCRARIGSGSSFAIVGPLRFQSRVLTQRRRRRISPRRSPPRRVARALAASGEEVEQQFAEEPGIIAIPFQSSVPKNLEEEQGEIRDQEEDVSSQQHPEGNVIECSGIITTRILPDSATRNVNEHKSYGDTELLSRCTSVAERSAIALATMAYERSKRLFSVVSANLSDLEITFKRHSKAFDSRSPSPFDDDDDPRDELRELNARLEQELSEKDHQLQLALMEVKSAHEQVRGLQDSAPKIIHDVDVFIDDSVHLINGDHRLDEAEEKSQQDLVLVEEKVASLLDKVGHLNGLVSGWKNAVSVLQLESQHSSDALQLSIQELVNAQTYIQNLKALTEKQAGDLLAKDEQLRVLHSELSSTKAELDRVSKSLAASQQQNSDMEKHIKRLEEALKHEQETIAAVIRSTSSQKEDLSAAEKKVASLTNETASLKSLLDGKEELILAMREEARRNSNMLVSAAKTREALLIAEKRIEQLTSQLNALDDEVKSRDMVLNEIKEEAVQSTEALRLAAQIKQDLNLSRQRELELSQELESMKNVVKDLRQEVVENNRAVRAEQALRHLESEMDEVTAEVDILRKGVEARDEAIQLMREEVDRNIDVLSHAAGNRELVRELEEHIEELQAELRKKDTKLAAMSKGLDVGSGISSSSSSLYKGGLYDDPPSSSSSYNLPSSPSSSSPNLQPSEARKRVSRNTSSYKRAPRHSS